jgi:hypothetical protein
MLRNMGSLRILVVGCGNMGASHARALRNMLGVEIVKNQVTDWTITLCSHN